MQELAVLDQSISVTSPQLKVVKKQFQFTIKKSGIESFLNLLLPINQNLKRGYYYILNTFKINYGNYFI